MSSQDDLKLALKEYCAFYSIKPALKVSSYWEIVSGFTSGKSVPDYDSPGCYALYTEDSKLQYIGRASRLGNRLGSYWSRKDGSARYTMCAPYTKLQTISVATPTDAKHLEAHLIAKLLPPCNKRREKHKP